MADKIIPLTTDPDQFFTCSLPIDNNNVTLSFRLRYNTVAEYWVITIADVYGNPIIDSLPILDGRYPSANLLGQYKYLNIGSVYIAKNGKVDGDRPNDTNLGSEFLLVWGDTNV